MRKFFSLPLFIAVMLLMASSCLSDNKLDPENPDPERTEAADVVLRIRTPDGFSGNGTRTTLSFNDENRLNSITVLVFDSTNQLIDIRQGHNITSEPGLNPPPPGTPEISGTGAFRVRLRASASPADVFRLVVIANAADAVLARLGTVAADVPNRSYNAVMAELWNGINGKMLQGNNPAIPMFGQTENPVHVIENTTLPETVRLHRAIARIDVGVGTASGHTNQAGFTWSGNNAQGQPIPFELASVYIMRPNNRFAVVPQNGVLPTDITGNPTIPTGTTAFTVEQSIDNFRFEAINGNVHRQIYIPEANIRMPQGGVTVADNYIRSGDLNHLNRMAVVVGGYFNGSSTRTYYRADLISNQADPRSLFNVLRNHLYQINIMGVTAPGERTPEDAYSSLAMNMNVEINEWRMVTEEMFFDGIEWIRLNHTRNESLSRHAILYRTANTIDELRFETTIPLHLWDMDGTGLGLSHGGTLVYCDCAPLPPPCGDPECNCPTVCCDLFFDVPGQTLFQTVENDRFRVQLIKTGTEIEPQTGRTIYHGFFRFTSLLPYAANAANNPSILHVEAGRIVGGGNTTRFVNFPITITQRGDSPDDWICGGYDDFELGEED